MNLLHIFHDYENDLILHLLRRNPDRGVVFIEDGWYKVFIKLQDSRDFLFHHWSIVCALADYERKLPIAERLQVLSAWIPKDWDLDCILSFEFKIEEVK